MNNLDFLKNPIVLGILAAVVTYLVMWYQEEQRVKKNEGATKKSVNIMTPGVVGALVWFIAGSYFDKSVLQDGGAKTQMIPNNALIQRLNESVPLDAVSDGSYDSRSYRLVGKGKIQLPQQDVFLDLANW